MRVSSRLNCKTVLAVYRSAEQTLTARPCRNLIPTKEFFFFGTDAVEPKTLSHYLKSEKSAETAHSNIAWASETGKGLLFVGDKKNPSSVISLVSKGPTILQLINCRHVTVS
jgi:hypothetical protein